MEHMGLIEIGVTMVVGFACAWILLLFAERLLLETGHRRHGR